LVVKGENEDDVAGGASLVSRWTLATFSAKNWRALVHGPASRQRSHTTSCSSDPSDQLRSCLVTTIFDE